jgi:hypothetical protein
LSPSQELNLLLPDLFPGHSSIELTGFVKLQISDTGANISFTDHPATLHPKLF